MRPSARPSPRQRRFVRAAAPIAGLALAGLLAWQGSTAAFTASTRSTGNAWDAGTLTLTSNTGGGGSFVAIGTAVFTVTGIKPGSTGTACVTVRSTGSAPGIGRFYVTNVVGTIPPALAPRIALTVESAALPDGSGPSSTIPSTCAGAPAMTVLHTAQALTDLPSSYDSALDSWWVAGGAGATQNRVYRITWTFTSAGTTSADNLLQGRSAGADLVWEIR